MATVTSTLANKPLFLQALGGDTAISYTAAEVRNLLGALMPRTGAVGGSSFRIVQRAAGANWSIDINPGFFVHGNSATESQRYLIRSDATVNLVVSTFNTAPVATRTHRVWINLYDKTVTGSEYVAKLMVTEDTGSGAPAPADSPAYTFELGQFVIAPSQTTVASANITNSGRKAAFGSSNFDLPMASGFISGVAATNGGPPRYAISGSQVHLAGVCVRSTGDFVAGTPYTIGTLPDGYRPRYERYMSGVGYTGYSLRVTVTTAGLVIITVPNIAGATVPDLSWVSLDGCVFEID